MAIRWYLMALDVIVEDGTAFRGPKYLLWRKNPTGLDVPWSAIDYGRMPVCICWADVTNGQHNQLVANADCKGIVQHANVDNQVAGAVTTARDVLEQLNIPGNWVQASDTWRNVLRVTIGLFQYAQRLHAKFNVDIVPSGYTLNTQWRDLPPAGQQFLLETAQELGIDTSGATGSTTLRQIYKAFGDAWGEQPIYMGSVTL